MSSNSRQRSRKAKQWDHEEWIMNYNDICGIYGRDLNLLLQRENHGSWLNDTIIHYWLIRLQETYQQQPMNPNTASSCSSSSSSSNIIDGLTRNNNNNDENDESHSQQPPPQQRQLSSSSSFIIFDPIVVSYLIHQLDIINTDEDDEDVDDDECHNFWNTHFHNRFPTTTTSTSVSQQLLLLRVLLPINDTMIPGTFARSYPPLGTHWSLLVIDIEPKSNNNSTATGTNTASISSEHWILQGYHMDSMASSSSLSSHHHSSGNIHCAQAVADQLQRLIQKMLAPVTHDSVGNSINSDPNTRTTTTTDIPQQQQQQPDCRVVNVNVQNVPVPQQTNGYDCGIHVLLNAETVLHATTTLNQTWMMTDDNHNYFYQHQQHRLKESHFSMLERQRIAQDIIQQYDKSTTL